jgi:hypothetical protein
MTLLQNERFGASHHHQNRCQTAPVNAVTFYIDLLVQADDGSPRMSHSESAVLDSPRSFSSSNMRANKDSATSLCKA